MKIGISVRAGISIREVAWELEEDVELDSRTPGAEGELTASTHVTCSCSTLPIDAALSVARARLLAANLYVWPPPTPLH